ncbi:hypothetical protein SAMN05192588_1154 [Nonlabens sp. Hel1_33_55]|uniref:hypothetical protein n=1 Tax=Nonlabens sp. Hel1_33_55 TaxID=1336802 RepID=UPI000875CCC6|nr:hypothetical protein [Nonlabens sp. Hel1_33_55]SCY10085.1 hypothetical protein SAMN05192588_1154 [Nonlabens sp. Hel1_33_55]
MMISNSNISFHKGGLESTLMKTQDESVVNINRVKLLARKLSFLILSLSFLACTNNLSNEAIEGIWEIQIKYNDANKDVENEFTRSLSVHPLTNIFKWTQTISFRDNGTLIMDKSMDVYPNYYFLDEKNEYLYMSFSPLNEKPSDNSRGVFKLKVNTVDNDHFLLNFQSDTKQQLELKKK